MTARKEANFNRSKIVLLRWIQLNSDDIRQFWLPDFQITGSIAWTAVADQCPGTDAADYAQKTCVIVAELFRIPKNKQNHFR